MRLGEEMLELSLAGWMLGSRRSRRGFQAAMSMKKREDAHGDQRGWGSRAERQGQGRRSTSRELGRGQGPRKAEPRRFVFILQAAEDFGAEGGLVGV